MKRREFIKNSAMASASLSLIDIAGIQGRNPEVTVRMHNGRPTVFIDGKPNALPGYSPGNSKEFFDKYMPLFYQKKMGVYLIWIDGWGASGQNRWWVGDTVSDKPLFRYDTDVFTLENQVQHILKGDPEAYIIVRFYTRPPDSWTDLHPNEFFINEEGKSMRTPSLASDAF